LTLPLKLGPLVAGGFTIHRSGVHWLRADGDLCRAGEVIGYCNVSLEPSGGGLPGRIPFAEERELQVALAPRAAGHLRLGKSATLGGHLDEFGVYNWDPEAVVAELELSADAGPNDGTLRLLMLAGRRVTGLADVLTGMLPGWHNRARGWWADQSGGDVATLLSIGICDAVGPVRGEHSAFTEMFEEARLPAQAVFVPNHPVAPCATCLFEQFERTPAAYRAISDDLMGALTGGGVKATPDDWLFVGTLLQTLEDSPIRDTYDLLTPSGLLKGGAPTAVLISATAEGTTTLVHKKLGYCLHLLPVYRDAAGPAVKAWLASAFEPVKRSLDDMKRDYLRLIDSVSAETKARFLILNKMSTSGREDVVTYTPFDLPLGDTLANVAAKEMNLMLDDVAASRDVTIIDVDAIATELGGDEHLPDGIHQSGTMQAEIRSEILQALFETAD